MPIKLIEKIINSLSKVELEQFFGAGSKVKFLSYNYSTQKKQYVLDCCLYISDVELGLEFLDAGALDILIEELFVALSIDTNTILLITSVELI